MWFEIARARTAIHRGELSRPLRTALADGLVTPATSVFDYGCGHGDDLRQLATQGIGAAGWDPLHRPAASKTGAAIVNLGYVVNVIEDRAEREAALREAWSLAQRVLIVAARLTLEQTGGEAAFEDGYLTRRNTFQKFYAQQELREWLQAVLGLEPVAAAPGVFYIFRDPAERESFTAARFRRAIRAPRPSLSDQVYEASKPLFDQLAAFLGERGRLPAPEELAKFVELAEKAGGIKRAFRILRRVYGEAHWQEVAQARAEDMKVYMALAQFGPQPRFSSLPLDLQLDIKAFFGSYARAQEQARALLHATGSNALSEEFATGPVGKLTPSALYVHRSALPHLSPLLRVYEGCGRVLVGAVEGADIIKLHRNRPKVSYLSYPDFETVAHPPLSSSCFVDLKTLQVDFLEYEAMENRPILHRKEEFLASDHPLRERFARLTRQEERHGLLDRTAEIGYQRAWEAVLAEKQLVIRGHVLRRCR